jgi:large subunit ribosomal protein L24
MIPDENRAVVRGVNIVRRHQRQTASAQGGIITKEMPIHLSNIALTDASGKATRVGFKMVGDRKVRFAKRSGDTIDG